ncbi:hypothetical protein T11_4214 [Trichinella zimbabwensis]|uniref:Uncharacterized protein n=1 Tax=Trichinella zimbabwensis TaxID=268475 RepID=A0A0V1H5Y2_9BILA|nr:hypothetical protein T11_4214 [Trichinella zimbabwensis]
MGHRLRRNSGRRRRSHRPRRDADVPAQTHHHPVICYESRTADERGPHKPYMRARLNNHDAGSGDTSRNQQSSSSNSRPNQRSGGRKRWQSDRRSRAHANSTAVENGADLKVAAPTSDSSHGRRPGAYNNRRTNKLRSVDAAAGEANTTNPRAGRTRTGYTSRAVGHTSLAADSRITRRSSPSAGRSSRTAGHAHVRAARTRSGHAGTDHAHREKTRADEARSNSSNSRVSLRREERSRTSKRVCSSSTCQTTAATSNTARRRAHQAKMRRQAHDTGLDRVDSNPDRSTGSHLQPQLNRHNDQADDYADGNSQQDIDEYPADDVPMNEVNNVDIRNMGSTVAGQSFFKVKNFKPLSSSKYIHLKMLKRFEKLYRKGSRYEESLLRRMRSTTVEPPVDETVHFKSIIMVSKRRFHKAKR